MKLTAEEVVAFLHAPVDKLALLNLLKDRCDALEIAEAECDSAIASLACNADEEYLECYSERRVVQRASEDYQELFVRVYMNMFDDNVYPAPSYEYCYAAYTELQGTIERLNNLTNLVEREERIRETLQEIASTIQKFNER